MDKQESFSEREKEVIARLLQGKSNKQIALELGVSLRTVEFHLSRIYAKLGVSSRTEAALQLSKAELRETAEGELRESTVRKMDESGDNDEVSIFGRRLPVKKSSLIALVILLATVVFFLGSLYQMMKDRAAGQVALPNPTRMSTATATAPAGTPTPATSSREHILVQIRQLVAEYEQAVQSEKKNGDVEYSKDPQTGEEIFLFQGESYLRIERLDQKLWENINQLNALYVQIYRDELKPTPFPTQNSAEERKLYYDSLTSQAENYCADVWNNELREESILVYRLDEGKYLPIGVGDEYARCETYGQMIEEWRTAPILAKVNQATDMTMIREVTGNPDLVLEFQAIEGTANAPGRNAALYIDETGAKYYVDVETARLVEIDPNFVSHVRIPAGDKKSMDGLRVIARQFAFTYSPRLGELESVLVYQESCKGDICFFRWNDRTQDWTGTDWMMMPPFLQVGVLADGQIVTYNNTLDLVE